MPRIAPETVNKADDFEMVEEDWWTGYLLQTANDAYGKGEEGQQTVAATPPTTPHRASATRVQNCFNLVLAVFKI